MSGTLKPEIIGDGKTVWVNGVDGCCLGRFSKAGIDIHKTMREQMNSGKQCLKCKHGSPTLEDWQDFRETLKKVYGVHVPDKLKPTFLA